MKFLDGFKTLIGLVGLIVTIVAPKISPELVNAIGAQVLWIAQGVFGLLTVLGVVHKVEKVVEKTKTP